MKILIINSYDTGGAAKACFRLHEGLLNKGVDSTVLLAHKKKNYLRSILFEKKQIEVSLNIKIKNKFSRILNEFKFLRRKKYSEKDVFFKTRPKELEIFSFPNSNFDITDSVSYKECSIVNLHWVAGFLDFSSFFEKVTKPVVWTLHDMNPFTGGDHYVEGYLGIDADGYPVTRKQTIEESIINEKNILNKIKALENVKNLTIVAPSQWLATEARKSAVFKGRRVVCVPYGLNAEIFAPRDKKFSRELLNIPQDKKVLLFVADSISNNRKGFVFLKKAFEELSDPNLILCAIGEMNVETKLNKNIIELGSIYDERLMSIAYSAADVFVIPSLMDNLPNTVLESLMCGTPVVGFPVGGIMDMIQNGKNGILTKEISVSALVESLNLLLATINNFDRNAIREDALMKYDSSIQAALYAELFEEINKSQAIY